MKKIIALLGALFVMTSGIFAADPAEGIWKSVDDKTGKVTAVWKIYEENGILTGKIVALADYPQDTLASGCKESYKGYPVEGAVNKKTTVDNIWIFGMKKEAEGLWKNGNIIDPSNGKMYGCIIKYLKTGEKNKSYTAKEPTLAMAGTVGPIQVFQYWIPGTEDDIKEIKEKFPASK